MSRARSLRSWWPGAVASTLVAAAALGAAVLRPLLAAPSPETPPAASRQVLRVGVPEGALRYANGLRDYTGNGLEPAFAQDLAAALGAELELVPLAPFGAAQALHDGRVDLALSRDEAGSGNVALLPTGLRSGVSVAMRSDTPVRAWSDLSGRALCATQGHVRAQAAAAGVRGQLRTFAAPAQALAAVRTGECDAALIDRAQLDALFQRPEWHKFSATLAPVEVAELSVLARADLSQIQTVREAARELGSAAQWRQRAQQWAANMAFEVYFDQVGPDCH
ncbi:transporter substrate-binding domain-containing protein [Acidovorax sp. Leaf160]|uniref:transporter substrate-binding domain-containing protein n=1 Tax=Acidovorax sp. Leaf160 TaxID=1736280 RepID=UPI0006F8CA5A|nr:transporter substrate-binding domain-containing protein [Acidovorax sp. Leaf160]